MIDENILSQVDPDGYHHQVLKDISDHSADGSVLKKIYGFIRSCGNNLHAKNTTRGWKIETEWKYGTLSCIPLRYLKVSIPVEIAEYAVGNNIEDETEFKLCVKDVFCKRDRIISKVTAK